MSDDKKTLSAADRIWLEYFWHEKGDLTRWAGWDEALMQRVRPDIVQAWRDYQAAKAVLDKLVTSDVVK
jgi:hypothetical protein